MDDLARLGFERWANALGKGLHSMKANGALNAAADPDELALATLSAL